MDVQHSQKLVAPANRYTHYGRKGMVRVSGRASIPVPVVVHDDRLACLPDPAGEAIAPLKNCSGGSHVGANGHGPFQHVLPRSVYVEATIGSLHQFNGS